MSLDEKAVAKLRTVLRGEAILPSAPAYDLHRRVFNARENRRPALIVRCAGAADVVASIRFAREHGLRPSAKGGGHGPTGWAVADDGLLLDLSLMRGVSVNPTTRTAIVQGGAVWKDVYWEAAAFGLLPAGGDCDMVGVAGFTLGGGWSYLSRTLGLAIDNLNWVQLVTADARLVTASATEHPDLFWALRGGGGGNFGVVTAFEFRLHPLPHRVLAGDISIPYKKAARALRVYADQVAGLPDPLYVDVNLGADPAGLSFTVIYLGPADAGRKALRPFIELAAPADVDLKLRPYDAVLTGYAETVVDGRLAVWKAGFLKPRLTDEVVETVVERFAATPSPSSLFFIETLGGAIGRVAPAATAYRHRDRLMCATVIGIWSETTAGEATLRWTRDLSRALRPALSGAAYVNYPDADLADWPRAYYGDNYPRLVDVKRRYDPDDVFRFPQSIGSHA